MRLQPFGLLPERWFCGGIIEEPPYNSVGPSEYYFFVLRLPFWKWDFLPCRDAHGWLQIALFFHGKRGFWFRWMDALPMKGTDTL